MRCRFGWPDAGVRGRWRRENRWRSFGLLGRRRKRDLDRGGYHGGNLLFGRVWMGPSDGIRGDLDAFDRRVEWEGRRLGWPNVPVKDG